MNADAQHQVSTISVLFYGIFGYIICGIMASTYNWRLRRRPQLGVNENDERLHIQTFQYSRAIYCVSNLFHCSDLNRNNYGDLLRIKQRKITQNLVTIGCEKCSICEAININKMATNLASQQKDMYFILQTV